METDRIVVLDLEDPDGWPLPPFTAGAHVEVALPGGVLRRYSLCGDPQVGTRYTLGVLAQPDGRGGSAAMHALRVGDVLHVSLPHHGFAPDPRAGRHLFIAGGIGLTPFLSMLPGMLRDGADFRLHVCARSPAVTPFLPQLRTLREAGRVVFHHGEAGSPTRLDVAALLREQRAGDHVYCCGPTSLQDAVAAATGHWAPGTVHFERFGAPPAATSTAGPSYRVALARRGDEFTVMAGETLAQALQKHGVPLDVSCGAGTCGTCRTRYLEGEPLHRDLVLLPAERVHTLTPCVSGCAGGRLVLDL